MPGADVIQEDADLVDPHRVLGWRDLLGPINIPPQGVNRPVLTTYDGEVEDYAFAVDDHYSPIKYHFDHDYAPRSDCFIHTHWSHNGTDISGNLVIEYRYIFSKGHGQQAFHAEKVLTHTISGLTIANTPAKNHRTDEILFSTRGGSVSLIDSDQIEPDALVVLHFNVLEIPVITGGAAKPFIHFVDCHYQTDRHATRRRVPNFYDNG